MLKIKEGIHKSGLLGVVLLFSGVIFLIIFLRLHSLGEPMERDQTFYAYVAHQMLNGEELYSSLWDHKPPGIFWIYMLSEILWGYDPSAIVYLGILFSCLSLFFLFLFLTKIAGIRVALIGSVFWALASNSILLQANQPNAEVFMNTCLFVSLWCFAKYSEGKRAFLFLSGLFFAVASLFKTIVIFPLATICVYLLFPLPNTDWGKWLKERSKEITLFLSAGVLIWAAVFLYYALEGRFDDFWTAIITFNRRYARNPLANISAFFIVPSLFLPQILQDIWVLVIFSFAWFSFSRKEYGPLRRSFFILLLFGVWVEVASPGNYHPHYYQLLIPVYAVLSALFLSDLADYLSVRKKGSGAAVLLFFLALGYLSYYQGVYLKMTPREISIKKYGNEYIDSYDLAKWIQNRTGKCETIHEWGNESGIYYYSKRNAASGIIYVHHIDIGLPDKSGDRVKAYYEGITSSPPAFFIWNDLYGKLENNMFLSFINENYFLLDRFRDDYTIYEYKFRKDKGKADC